MTAINTTTTTATATATAIMAAPKDGEAVLSWTVGVAGTARHAYTARGLMAAPKAARESAAEQAVLRALSNGQYVGFLRECAQALNKKQLQALRLHLIALTGDISLTFEGVIAAPSKANFRAVAAFMAAPNEVKKVEGQEMILPAPLAKSRQWISKLAADWIAANP